MIFFLIVVAALSFFVPSAPVELPPEPPIMEAVETRIEADTRPNALKTARYAVILIPVSLAWKLSRIRARRKRVLKTDNVQFALLMRRLNDMAAIMESITTDE